VEDLGDVLNSNLGDFGISSVPLSLSLGLFVSLGLVGLVLILFLMLAAWLVLACCACCRVAMANNGPKKTNRPVFGRCSTEALLFSGSPCFHGVLQEVTFWGVVSKKNVFVGASRYDTFNLQRTCRPWGRSATNPMRCGRGTAARSVGT